MPLEPAVDRQIWPSEGGLLDRGDKMLSSALASLPLGVLEYFLGFPGMFFATSQCVLLSPATIALLVQLQVQQAPDEDDGAAYYTTKEHQHEHEVVGGLAVVFACVVLGWFLSLVAYGLMCRATSTSNPRTLALPFQYFWGKYGYLLCPSTGAAVVAMLAKENDDRIHLPTSLQELLFLREMNGNGKGNGFCLFSSAAVSAARRTALFWCVSVAGVMLLKELTKRRRPLVLIDKEKRRRRRVEFFEAFIEADPHSSFPSGDTAGATAVAFSLFLAGSSSGPPPVPVGSPPRLGSTWPGTIIQMGIVPVALAVLAGFGRVYWQAHHVLDVVAAAVLSLAVCSGLRLAGWDEWKYSAFAGHFLFLLAGLKNIAAGNKRGRQTAAAKSRVE
eukprot:g7472.t1